MDLILLTLSDYLHLIPSMETGVCSARVGGSRAIEDGQYMKPFLYNTQCGTEPILRVMQYEFERRKFAQELIAFDKWYEASFSTKARAEIFEGAEEDIVAPVEPHEYVHTFTVFLSRD